MKNFVASVAVLAVVAVAICLMSAPTADAGFGCGYGYGYSPYCAPCYNSYYVAPVIPVHTCVPNYYTPYFHRCW